MSEKTWRGIRKIAVIGAGAMGAFYAAKFFDMDPGSVFLIANGERYTRLKSGGIVVNGKRYDIRVKAPAEGTDPFDLILCAVKHHQLDSAIEDMRPLVGDDSIIISVMNGIDSEKRIEAALGKGKVLLCAAVGIDAVRDENSVTYSKEGKLVFGEAYNASLSEHVLRLQNLFIRTRIPNEIPQDMTRALWWKFMVNVGVNQVSAVLKAPYGVFQRSEDASYLTDMAMMEVIEVARKEGVDLKADDISKWNEVVKGLSPDGKTSMLQDVEAWRRTEVDMFAGRVIELGRKHGLPTPVNQVLYRCIRVIESGF